MVDQENTKGVVLKSWTGRYWKFRFNPPLFKTCYSKNERGHLTPPSTSVGVKLAVNLRSVNFLKHVLDIKDRNGVGWLWLLTCFLSSWCSQVQPIFYRMIHNWWTFWNNFYTELNIIYLWKGNVMSYASSVNVFVVFVYNCRLKWDRDAKTIWIG